MEQLSAKEIITLKFALLAPSRTLETILLFFSDDFLLYDIFKNEFFCRGMGVYPF